MSRDTEYQTLRKEILDRSGRQFNMVSFALTVTVALIGYGLTNSNALIFLVPLLMLAMILIHLVRNIYAILRITSYIRLFIEPEEKNLKWETYMRQFRTEEKDRKYFIPIQHTLPSYELVLFVTGWICIVLAFFYAKGYQLLVPIVIAVLWLLFWIVVRRWINYQTSGQLERDFDAIWTEVAKVVNESTEDKSTEEVT
jgi:hypothetical protein